MFDTLAILPALIALGLFAAAILPKPDVNRDFKGWTEADFEWVVQHHVKP